MIRRVYEQARKSRLIQEVVVATDDERIAAEVRGFGGTVVMTAPGHPSGTDRCFEALQQLQGQYKYVVNIQGDEPFLDPRQIDELAAVLNDDSIELATQMIRIGSYEELFDPGEVKIVLNHLGEALYFSRQPIPYLKGVDPKEWHLRHNYYRHVGLYAYRTDVLRAITRLPVSSLEQAESLEQLRWLEAGYIIKCVPTRFESYCIDTPEDIQWALAKLSGQKGPSEIH